MAEKSKNSSPLVSFTGQARTRQRSRASSTPLFWAGLREGGPLGTAEVGFSLLGGGSREPPGWSPPPPPKGSLDETPQTNQTSRAEWGKAGVGADWKGRGPEGICQKRPNGHHESLLLLVPHDCHRRRGFFDSQCTRQPQCLSLHHQLVRVHGRRRKRPLMVLNLDVLHPQESCFLATLLLCMFQDHLKEVKGPN